MTLVTLRQLIDVTRARTVGTRFVVICVTACSDLPPAFPRLILINIRGGQKSTMSLINNGFFRLIFLILLRNQILCSGSRFPSCTSDWLSTVTCNPTLAWMDPIPFGLKGAEL